MKQEEIIEAWMAQKRSITGDTNFADTIIQRIESPRRRRRFRLDRIRVPEWIWQHPVVQLGWIGAASVVGFVRGMFLLRVALGG